MNVGIRAPEVASYEWQVASCRSSGGASEFATRHLESAKIETAGTLPRILRHAPDFLAAPAIQRQDERPVPHLLIALQDDEVFIEDRRRARSEAGLDDAVRERLFPDECAVEGIREQSGRLEERVHSLAIHRHRRRGSRL